MFRRITAKILAPFYEPIKTRLHGIAGREAANAVLMGQVLADRFRSKPILSRLTDAEFQVFSQFGEDGILQYLFAHVPAPDRTFVEIGVQDYNEANTRFLLLAGKWRGLIIDCTTEAIEHVKASDLAWRTALSATAAFVTRESINDLFTRHAIGPDLGLFSLDIDGNDYWVWEALEVARPRVFVCEINRLYGPNLAVTIPYNPGFVAQRAHPSRWYYGVSLAAITRLSEAKGYSLVGVTSEGVNAFFVRKELLGPLMPLTAVDAYSHITPEAPGSTPTRAEKLAAIGELPVIDLDTGRQHPLRDLVPN